MPQCVAGSASLRQAALSTSQSGITALITLNDGHATALSTTLKKQYSFRQIFDCHHRWKTGVAYTGRPHQLCRMRARGFPRREGVIQRRGE